MAEKCSTAHKNCYCRTAGKVRPPNVSENCNECCLCEVTLVGCCHVVAGSSDVARNLDLSPFSYIFYPSLFPCSTSCLFIATCQFSYYSLDFWLCDEKQSLLFTINSNCYCHIGVIRILVDRQHIVHLLNGLGFIGGGRLKQLEPPPQEQALLRPWLVQSIRWVFWLD